MIDKINNENKKKPIVLRDFFTDTYYNGVYDETKQQLDILISEGYIKESKLSSGYYVAI